MMQEYINGRYGSPACVEYIEYSNGSIVASVDKECATANQLRRWAEKKYPGYILREAPERGKWWHSLDILPDQFTRSKEDTL